MRVGMGRVEGNRTTPSDVDEGGANGNLVESEEVKKIPRRKSFTFFRRRKSISLSPSFLPPLIVLYETLS